MGGDRHETGPLAWLSRWWRSVRPFEVEYGYTIDRDPGDSSSNARLQRQLDDTWDEVSISDDTLRTAFGSRATTRR